MDERRQERGCYSKNRVRESSLNIRNKGDKLGLWTRDARKGDATVKIG